MKRKFDLKPILARFANRLRLLCEILGLSSKVLFKRAAGIRTNTYCPRLWDFAYIDEQGGVSPCCSLPSGLFGNIYKKSLREIWSKGWRVKIYRWFSLNGFLSCFHDCPHLSLKEKKNDLRFRAPERYPQELLHITYGTLCNFSCSMCPQDHLSKTALDQHVLERHVDWDHTKEIIIQGGEVLAIPAAKNFYLWATQKQKKKVNLITNGILINREWAEHLLRGSEWIEVSVNAVSESVFQIVNNHPGYHQVIENIKSLVALKKQLQLAVTIRFHFTIVRQNFHELGGAITFAEKLNCDIITYSYDHDIPQFITENKELADRIRNAISQLVEKGNLRIKIRGQFLEHLGLLEPALADSPSVVYCT